MDSGNRSNSSSIGPSGIVRDPSNLRNYNEDNPPPRQDPEYSDAEIERALGSDFIPPSRRPSTDHDEELINNPRNQSGSNSR